MPRPHPPELRQRAVELARLREKPVAQIAEDSSALVQLERAMIAPATKTIRSQSEEQIVWDNTAPGRICQA